MVVNITEANEVLREVPGEILSILYDVDRKGLANKVALQQRFEGCEG